MLRPRWRKVLADLWENKSRTALVVASIAIGVFAVGMIAGTYLYLLEDMQSTYVGSNPSNIRLITDPFRSDLIDTLGRLDSVQAVEGRRTVKVRALDSKGKWTSLELIAVEDFSQMQINHLLLKTGVSTLADQQVIMESNKKLDRFGAAVGDVLTLELADGTRRSLPVVGTAQDQTGGVSNMVGNVKGYVTFKTLEWLHAPSSYNTLYITVRENTNDPAHIQAVSKEIQDKLVKGGRTVYREERYRSDEHPMSSLIQALLGVMFFLGVLVVFLSGSLISNTISALLKLQQRQIGVMKLVGARSKQIIVMYITLILIFGGAALLVSIPLSAQAAYALAAFAGTMIGFTLQGFRVFPLVTTLQIIIALLVPPLAGLLPIFKGARTTVHQAIHSTAISDSSKHTSPIDRLLAGIRGLSRPLLISLRNTFRQKGRLALTLFTLTLGGSIFIAVFNVQEALNVKIEQSLKYFLADVNLDLDRDYRVEQIASLVGSIPGVERVEGWQIGSAEILNDDKSVAGNITLFAPPIESDLVEPELLGGRWLQPGDSNAITVNEAYWKDYPDLTPGSTIRLKISGREQDWQVVGIFQYTGAEDYYAFTDYDSLAGATKTVGRSSTYRVVTTSHDPALQREIAVEIDNLLQARGIKVSKVEAGSTTVQTVTDYIGILTAVLLVMAILTALVGSIGLAGTLGMNVMERTREIGVMRAIGAFNQIIMRLVIVEGLVIGMLSYALSMVLCLPISSLLSNVVSLAIFNAPAQLALTYKGFVIWLLLVVALSVVASMVPARNASRMTIREVLAYE